MEKILNQMENIQSALEELIDKCEELRKNRSEKWQDSKKGEEYENRTDRLREMREDIINWQLELGY